MTVPTTAKVFAIVDAMDLQSLGDLFSERGSLIFANRPALVGADEIRQGVGCFYDTIAGLQHTIIGEWTVGADTIIELSVTYHRHDGGEVTIPAATMWRVDSSGKIDSYRVYFDLAPVYA
ncbi:nuclear transport factor 2 family protein [Mycolicibacterium cosmeticum]|uniref:nuclear transport factor 2 family protein n=1 Tax=Mycolicibacterium cosmeticum TaxID=258533 RepID=UPI0032049F5A